MALKPKGKPQASRVEQEVLEPGSYPARVVQIIDLGVQLQRPYKGEEKPPAHEIMFTYELLDEFCKDENGDIDEGKPRWLSETFPLRSLEADLAKSTKRYKVLDPNNAYDGDFTLLIEGPCLITVVNSEGSGKNEGKVYNNIGAVSRMRPRDEEKAPPLVNPTKVFVLDEPDLGVFLALPTWLQDKIKSNLEFEGSALYKALKRHQGDSGSKSSTKEEPSDAIEEEDVPW